MIFRTEDAELVEQIKKRVRLLSTDYMNRNNESPMDYMFMAAANVCAGGYTESIYYPANGKCYAAHFTYRSDLDGDTLVISEVSIGVLQHWESKQWERFNTNFKPL